MPVLRWQQPHAALIGRAQPNDGVRARAFLQEAARCLGPALEREMLLERSAERERTLAEASERQLMRLGFDLHDGPLQDLAVLAMDVHSARAEIGKRVPARSRKLVSGRLDDIHAQINTLEQSLREVARSLQPMSVLERPLADVLRGEVEKFESARHRRASRSSSAASSKGSPPRSASRSTASCRKACRTSATTARRRTCASRSTAGAGRSTSRSRTTARASTSSRR